MKHQMETELFSSDLWNELANHFTTMRRTNKQLVKIKIGRQEKEEKRNNQVIFYEWQKKKLDKRKTQKKWQKGRLKERINEWKR